MFCSQCGKQIPKTRTVCVSCEEKMANMSVSIDSQPSAPLPSAADAAPIAPALPKKRKNRTILWMILGVLVVAIAAAAIWYFTRPEEDGDSDNNSDTGADTVIDTDTNHTNILDPNTSEPPADEDLPSVLTIGDHHVTASEFNYFYHDVAANHTQYASYLGIDTETPLTEQKIKVDNLSFTGILGITTTCLDSLTPVDGVYDFTWAELLSDNAMRNAASAYAVYQEAEKAGFSLDAEALASIDSSVAELKTYADRNSISVDEYIETVFGRGCDEEGYRQYMKVINTASAYPDAITYTQEEKDACYLQNPADFDTVAFYYYINNASTIKFEEEISMDVATDETEAEATARRDAAAKEAAEQMAAEFDVNDENVAIHADYTREYLEVMLTSIKMPDEAVDWLFDEATEGEIKMFTMEDETEELNYVVIRFITREDYNTKNYLSITISDDEETANDTIAEIKASLESDPSEENFRNLIASQLEYDFYARSFGGEYENQTRCTAGYNSKALFTWLMLEDRSYGDWTMINTDYDTSFYFYLGEGQSYCDMCIEATLLNEWYENLTENAIVSCNYDANACKENCNLGFYD